MTATVTHLDDFRARKATRARAERERLTAEAIAWAEADIQAKKEQQ